MYIHNQAIAFVALLSLVPGSLASHAVYTNAITGETIEVSLDGIIGETTEYFVMNTTDVVPSIHYITLAELATTAEQRRDICEDIATCFTNGAYNVVLFASGVTWANTAGNCVAAYNTISNYLTANNYANTNAILQGVVVGLIVTFPQFYINMRLQNTDVATTNDACGSDTAPTVANNAANAIYAYCQGLQANQQNNLPTGYGALDVDSATDVEADGFEALATVFLSSQAGVYAPICSAVGVTWKRSIYRLGQVVRSAVNL